MSTSLPSGRLTGLTSAECLDLLATQQVGRVLYCDDRGPVAVLVNFVLDEGTILLRTSPENTVAQHLKESPTCAFEVDEIDLVHRSGWSVLVRGSASLVRHLNAGSGVRWPTPWPEGNRHLLLRITPGETTGRRLSPF